MILQIFYYLYNQLVTSTCLSCPQKEGNGYYLPLHLCKLSSSLSKVGNFISGWSQSWSLDQKLPWFDPAGLWIMRSWGNMSSVLAIKCHQMNQLAISFYFQRCMRWRLTRYLGGKKNISAQETSGIQVHQVKSIRLQRFLLLFHFSVQLGMVGLLNTLPGRSLVQFSRSVVYDSLRPHGLHLPGLPVHHQLPELTQTHVC